MVGLPIILFGVVLLLLRIFKQVLACVPYAHPSNSSALC